MNGYEGLPIFDEAMNLSKKTKKIHLLTQWVHCDWQLLVLNNHKLCADRYGLNDAYGTSAV
jgi:hypothetical protein